MARVASRMARMALLAASGSPVPASGMAMADPAHTSCTARAVVACRAPARGRARPVTPPKSQPHTPKGPPPPPPPEEHVREVTQPPGPPQEPQEDTQPPPPQEAAQPPRAQEATQPPRAQEATQPPPQEARPGPNWAHEAQEARRAQVPQEAMPAWLCPRLGILTVTRHRRRQTQDVCRRCCRVKRQGQWGQWGPRGTWGQCHGRRSTSSCSPELCQQWCRPLAQSRQFLALVARLTARSRRSRPIRCPWPHGHRPADNAHAPNAAYGARAHAHTGAADAVPGLPGLPGPRPRPTKVPACATAAATAGAEAEAAGLHTAECCAAGGGHPSATEGNGRG